MIGKVIGASVLVLAAGGALYYYKQQSELLKKYKIDIVDWRARNYNLATTDLELTFKISSYGQIEAIISDVALDVFINDQFTASAIQPGNQVIPAMGYNYLKVNVQVRNTQLVKQAIDIIGGSKNQPITIRIKGTVKVKTGWIGINIPVDSVQETSLAKLATS